MKIRAITCFANLPARNAESLRALGAFADHARRAYTEAGFEVQTVRLALDFFREPALPASLAATCATLEAAAREQGFAYLALGPAPTGLLPRVPALLAATQATFISAHLIDPLTGALDGAAIRAAAAVIREAAAIEDGFGNLRFAALANVPPGTPFFPAAYHDGGAPAFALATESADLAVAACAAAGDAVAASQTLTAAVEAHAARLAAVGEALSREHGLRFGGIDFSLAPFPSLEISIGAALERLSGAALGAPGTLAAAAMLTAAVQQARFPRAGFCGLMLPVLEDPILAQRAAEGRLRLGELLQWSAVCGTGLDTVPLPGDASAAALVGVLWDVAALSARLGKPLTARLMPLPGKVAGDPTHFDFAFFADGGVLPLEETPAAGPLSATGTLALARRGQ